jgi:GNAT superfamily N-acetyltransferase
MLIYVADQAGEVVGFIGGGPVRESVQTYDAELYAIYLLQRSQGQGIGTALLQQLARSLLNEGFTSMLVWVLEKNPSKHFYTKANAQFVTSKDIRIGGALLAEEAYGWPDLSAILHA